jgi:hypothetical protein
MVLFILAGTAVAPTRQNGFCTPLAVEADDRPI